MGGDQLVGGSRVRVGCRQDRKNCGSAHRVPHLQGTREGGVQPSAITAVTEKDDTFPTLSSSRSGFVSL